MQMKLKSVKNTTQMTLQSYVAKAYMLSYIQQKSVEFYYVLQATSKTAPTDLNRKNVFFQKWNGGFIQLGKMVSIDKISASNSKFENLRWTPYYREDNILSLTVTPQIRTLLVLHFSPQEFSPHPSREIAPYDPRSSRWGTTPQVNIAITIYN